MRGSSPRIMHLFSILIIFHYARVQPTHIYFILFCFLCGSSPRTFHFFIFFHYSWVEPQHILSPLCSLLFFYIFLRDAQVQPTQTEFIFCLKFLFPICMSFCVVEWVWPMLLQRVTQPMHLLVVNCLFSYSGVSLFYQLFESKPF